jgi:hypothetical protein
MVARQAAPLGKDLVDQWKWAKGQVSNRSSAHFLISSPLMDGDHNRLAPDYDLYRTRKIAGGE